MAYAVLKAMNFDGDIGNIELDWPRDSAATDAAQTASVSGRGRIGLESSRLPVCFFDDTAASEGYPSVPCRYVLEYCPFHRDLNRYMLHVRGLPNRPIRVTWGDRGVVFTREQLEAGINLASEFPENPFCPTMRALDAAISAQTGLRAESVRDFESADLEAALRRRQAGRRSQDPRRQLEGLFQLVGRGVFRRSSLARRL